MSDLQTAACNACMQPSSACSLQMQTALRTGCKPGLDTESKEFKAGYAAVLQDVRARKADGRVSAAPPPPLSSRLLAARHPVLKPMAGRKTAPAGAAE